MAQQASKPEPLVIQEQGSFAVGGTVVTSPGTFDPFKPPNPAGQTYRGDHLYAFYQVPVNARRLPLVMWHGAGQFSKTWETTPDGRDGFQLVEFFGSATGDEDTCALHGETFGGRPC